ncbi:MAG: transcription elongation factor GreA [Eubacteriales bacterium]|nr:transcription elongation factor GreA [Eubacteriales bacterium]
MPNDANRVVLTPEGKRKLEEELQELKGVKRKEIADEIRTARGFGDLSENAEYDEAKNAQARMETRVRQIEEMLRDCIVVDESSRPADTVTVGRAVRVFDMEYEEEDVYTVVGSTEADPSKLYVSSESPIGSALIGRHVGDIADVQTPGGIIKLKVLEIKPA